MQIGESGSPEVVQRASPLPRINAGMLVERNTLYLYGGLLEVGDREITLDDFWKLDLSKREKWECIDRGTMHQQVWKGVQSDNDSSYISGGATEGNDSDSEEDDINFKSISEEKVEESDSNSHTEKKHKKKSKTKSKRNGLREEMDRLKQLLDLDNVNRTPLVDEELATFYSRTSSYWNDQAMANVKMTENAEILNEKELRREGFLLAQERFLELKPVLDRLNELDKEQKLLETERKQKKRGNKEKKEHKSKKSSK